MMPYKEKDSYVTTVAPSNYNYWQAMFRSFYLAGLYVDIAKRWRGFGIGYLLLIISLASLPLSVRTIMEFNQFFVKQVFFPVEILPRLSVQQGQIIFEKSMPFLIKNQEGQVVSLIDTTGMITGFNDTYPHLSVLVTKNIIYFRLPNVKQFLSPIHLLSNNKIYSQSLDNKDNGIFDGNYWIENSGIKKLKRLVQIVIFPVIVLFYLGLYLCFMLIFAAMGQLIASTVLGLKLSFKRSCRLFAVACTPQIGFFFIIKTMKLPLPELGFYSLVLLIGYFYYAILSVKREANIVNCIKSEPY